MLASWPQRGAPVTAQMIQIFALCQYPPYTYQKSPLLDFTIFLNHQSCIDRQIAWVSPLYMGLKHATRQFSPMTEPQHETLQRLPIAISTSHIANLSRSPINPPSTWCYKKSGRSYGNSATTDGHAQRQSQHQQVRLRRRSQSRLRLRLRWRLYLRLRFRLCLRVRSRSRLSFRLRLRLRPAQLQTLHFSQRWRLRFRLHLRLRLCLRRRL